MISFKRDGQIVLKYHAGSNTDCARLSLEEAEILADSLRAQVDGALIEANERSDSMVRALTKETQNRCNAVRGKMPWQITRRAWEAVHAPARWTRELAAVDLPPYLAPLMGGRQNLRAIRVVDQVFHAAMSWYPYGFRAPAKLTDQRHEAHVAWALARKLVIPACVLQEYPSQWWTEANMLWVVRHLDRAAWASQLAGRAVEPQEIEALESYARRTWPKSPFNQPNPLSDQGQLFQFWTPAQINALLTKRHQAA